MTNEFWNIIGFTASILSAITFIPELIKAFRTHKLKDLSWGVLVLLLTSSILWLGYSINFDLTPLFFSSLINTFCGLILAIFKFKFSES